MYDREYGRRGGRSEDWGEDERGWRDDDFPAGRGGEYDRDRFGVGRRTRERESAGRSAFGRDEERYGEYGYGRDDPRRGRLYYGRFEGVGAGGRYSGAFVGYRGMGPRGYRRSDERIHEDACERLTDHPGVDAREMEIRVEDGVVSLSGTVDDRRQKRLAEDVLDDVPGVRDVDNRLRVRDRETAGRPRTAATSGTSAAGTAGAAGIWAFRNPSWRGNDLSGFEVEALDGKIGKVDDRTQPGSDTLVVDTGPWIFGRHVLLPVGLIEGIDLDAQTIFVDRAKDEIKNAPEYVPEHGASPDLRHQVGEYYGSRGVRREPLREEERVQKR